jgi:hypothetical protein
VKDGDRVYVFDGKKSPEAYGKQPPVWDKVVDLTPTTTPPKTTRRSDAETTVKKTTTTRPTSRRPR